MGNGHGIDNGSDDIRVVLDDDGIEGWNFIECGVPVPLNLSSSSLNLESEADEPVKMQPSPRSALADEFPEIEENLSRAATLNAIGLRLIKEKGLRQFLGLFPSPDKRVAKLPNQGNQLDEEFENLTKDNRGLHRFNLNRK